MTPPVVKVEIGFESSETLGTNFVLDDAIKGVLDNTTYTLAGTVYIDVTQWCSGVVNINRGRSREVDQYQAGTLSFTLRNEDRRFDPSNTASPYYPGILPRARVNAYLDGIQIFGGYVDDLDVQYVKPNICTVMISCLDGFGLLANAFLVGYMPISMTTGVRISDVLNQSSVAFPATRSIAVGQTQLQAAGSAINNTAALDHCQTCARSENGYFFIDRIGTLTFFDRYKVNGETSVATFSDLGDGIAYFDIGQKSQTLLLYNGANGTRTGSSSPQMATDPVSINQYGPRTLSVGQLENNSDQDVLNLCQYLVGRYAQPDVRFDTMTVELNGFGLTIREQLAALELVQLVTIKRTPPGSGSPATISKLQIIDGIKFALDVSSSTYRMSFQFGSIDAVNFFKLDDSIFGVLDSSKLSY